MDGPTTFIHIRHYKPLSVSFPAPGVYTGNIIFILPSLDPTFLSRVLEEGESPLTIEFFAETPITAAELRGILVKSIGKLRSISSQFSSPVRNRQLAKLRFIREDTKMRHKRIHKLIDRDLEL